MGILLVIVLLAVRSAGSFTIYGKASLNPNRIISSTSTISKKMSTSIQNEEYDDDAAHIANLYNEVTFLGKGKEAIIEPGVLLISPKFESSHWLSKTAILICAIGLNADGVTAVRGVMIDNPTPFTISEMTNSEKLGKLGNNLLFRGGDEGAESIMLLHNNPDIPSTPIGTNNLFQGGVDYATTAVKNADDASDFKFFFNYIEFDVDSLNKILSEEDEDGGGDAWISVSAPSDLIL